MSGPVPGLTLLLAGALIGLWAMWVLRREAAREAEITRAEAQPPAPLLRGALDDRFGKTGLGSGLAVRLQTAGVEQSPVAFLVVTAVLAALAYVVAHALVPSFIALLAAAATVMGRFAWLDRQREQRRMRFVAQLPELARLLSNSTSAGLAMAHALVRASTELGPPAGPELRRTVAEMRYTSLDQALEGLGRRLPSRELSVLVTTLVIQERVGGNVVQALRELATTLEARQETLREVRTLMSGAVFSSYLVAILGVASLAMLSTFGDDVLDRFTGTGLGIAVLVVASTLYALGFLLIRRTTRIEV